VTMNLGVSTTTPDGMHLVVRDISDVSTHPVTMDCTVSGCSVCPLGGTCGTTQTLNTIRQAWHFLFYAASNYWIEIQY
jgi:hypothetical protein